MNIDVWKISRIYTKSQVNVKIKISTRQLLKHQWSQHLKDVPTTVQWHLTHMCLLKSIVQENYSVNLQIHCISDIRLIFVGLVQPRQSVRQPKKAMCCDKILKSDVFIQKSIKRSENTFTIGFCIILRLCYIQLKKIIFMYLLMATPKNS